MNKNYDCNICKKNYKSYMGKLYGIYFPKTGKVRKNII